MCFYKDILNEKTLIAPGARDSQHKVEKKIPTKQTDHSLKAQNNLKQSGN